MARLDARLLVHQVEQLTGITRKTISKFYGIVRVRMRDYMADHLIVFQRDELVEIDELFIGALRTPPNRDGEGGEWPPVLGMIGRQSRRVVVEISETSRLAAPVLPSNHTWPPTGSPSSVTGLSTLASCESDTICIRW